LDAALPSTTEQSRAEPCNAEQRRERTASSFVQKLWCGLRQDRGRTTRQEEEEEGEDKDEEGLKKKGVGQNCGKPAEGPKGREKCRWRKGTKEGRASRLNKEESEEEEEEHRGGQERKAKEAGNDYSYVCSGVEQDLRWMVLSVREVWDGTNWQEGGEESDLLS
jgi:hypothetical protein